jgi:tetratricopeptide (TPR) repeat protein
MNRSCDKHDSYAVDISLLESLLNADPAPNNICNEDTANLAELKQRISREAHFFKSNPPIALSSVYTLMENHCYNDAIQVARQIIPNEFAIDEAIEVIQLIIKCYASMQEYDQAIAFLQDTICEYHDYRFRLYPELIDLLCHKHDYSGALDILTTLVKEEKQPWIYDKLGLVALYMQDYQQAIDNAHRAVAQEPDDVGYFANLMSMYVKTFQFVAARKAVSALPSTFPRSEAQAQLGAIFEAEGNFAAAASTFRKLAQSPEANEAHYIHLSKMLSKQFDYDSAITVMEDYLHRHPGQSEVYEQLSCIYEAKGQRDKAIDCARQSVSLDRNNMKNRLRLSHLLRKYGDFEAAVEAMDAAATIDPYWSEPYAQYAMVHAAKSERDEAIACARKAIVLDPFNLPRRAQLSDLLRAYAAFDKARDVMEEAIKINPYWSEPYAQFALMHDAKGEREAAIANARKAVAVEPYALERRKQLSNLLRKYGDFTAAREVMDAAARINPYWSETDAQYALIYDATGEREAALASARNAVDIDPYNLGRLTQLCFLLRKYGDFDAAWEVMDKGAKLNPCWSEPHVQFAAMHELENEKDKAVASAENAVAVDPSNLKLQTKLGNLLRKYSCFDQARARMTELAATNPYWSEPYAQYAYIHAAKSERDAAIAAACKAIRIEPYNSDRYMQLCILYRKYFDFDAAYDVMREAAKINPFSSEPYAQYAFIQEEKGDLDAAIANCLKALSVEPSSLLRRTQLSNALRKYGDFDAATRAMQEGALLNPYWSEPYAQYALMHDAKGERDAALDNARKAISVEPFNLGRYTQLSVLLQKYGSLDEAHAVMAKAAAINPCWSEPHARYAVIHDAEGDVASALASAAKALECEPYAPLRRTQLSNLLRKYGRFDAARAIMNEGERINPYWSEPYAQYALIHDAKGERQEALDCARKAMTIDPYNLTRRTQLSNLLRKYGHLDEALTVMQGGEQINSYWTEAYFQYALIHEAQGKRNDAVANARKALAVNPRNLVCRVKLCNLLRRFAFYDDARLVMKEGEKMHPYWSEPYAQYALIHEAKNQRDKALACARKALALDPHNPERRAQLEALLRN